VQIGSGLPVTEGDERCPVGRRGPFCLVAQLALRVAQGVRSTPAVKQQVGVEAAHELCCGPVIDLPQTHDKLAGAGGEEAVGEADHPLTADLLAQSRLTG
jgi:hypothetical protein